MFLEQSTSAEGDLGGAGAPRANISEKAGEASSGDEQEDGLEAAQCGLLGQPPRAIWARRPETRYSQRARNRRRLRSSRVSAQAAEHSGVASLRSIRGRVDLAISI
ncbi:hypothetical protein AcV7_008440 [Taiwanofungus camphoratus]|nr:hypothetical protein AcV7_008440 [Antrodia cinnamomea]